MAIPIPDIVSIPRAAPIDDRLFFITKGIIHRMATQQEILKENDLLKSMGLKITSIGAKSHPDYNRSVWHYYVHDGIVKQKISWLRLRWRNRYDHIYG